MRIRVGLALACIALVAAAVSTVLALTLSSSNDDSAASRGSAPPPFALQLADFPATDFSLTDANVQSREDIVQELPADAQIAETGLREAHEVRYVSGGELPMIVSVLIYTYDDEKTARTAHMFLRNSDWPALRPVVLDSAQLGYAFQSAEAGLLDGLGEEAFWMEGYVDRVEDYGGVDLSNSVNIYFMQSGSKRAEMLVFGSHIFVDPFRLARNQYLRLEKADELLRP
jgi:hypothetical protein